MGGSEGTRAAAWGALRPDALHPVSICSFPRGLWVAGACVFLRCLCLVGHCAGCQGRAHPRYSQEGRPVGGWATELPLCAVTLSSRQPALTTPRSLALVHGLVCFCDLSSS